MPKTAFDKEHAKKLFELIWTKEGESQISDEDLLFLLLYFANCPKGVKKTTDNILRHFGTCQRAYLASYEELKAVDGVTHSAAVLILLVTTLMCPKKVGDYIGKRNIDYVEMFSSVIRRSFDEELWAAAISDDGRLIAAGRLAVGTSATVNLKPSTLLRFAGINKASAVVAAHTHPLEASAEPSKEDIKAAKLMNRELTKFGVKFMGHVIISGRESKYYPFDASEA